MYQGLKVGETHTTNTQLWLQDVQIGPGLTDWLSLPELTVSLGLSLAGGTQCQRTKPLVGTKRALRFKGVTQLARFNRSGGGGVYLRSPRGVILLWEAGPTARGGGWARCLALPLFPQKLPGPGGRTAAGSPLPPSFPGEGAGTAAPVCDLAGTCYAPQWLDPSVT